MRKIILNILLLVVLYLNANAQVYTQNTLGYIIMKNGEKIEGEINKIGDLKVDIVVEGKEKTFESKDDLIEAVYYGKYKFEVVSIKYPMTGEYKVFARVLMENKDNLLVMKAHSSGGKLIYSKAEPNYSNGQLSLYLYSNNKFVKNIKQKTLKEDIQQYFPECKDLINEMANNEGYNFKDLAESKQACIN